MKNKLLFALVILPVFGFSQINLNLQKPPVKSLRMKDALDVSINNPLGEQRRVYLVVNIDKSDMGRVAEVRTEDFVLQPGMKRINPEQLNITRKEFLDSRVEEVVSKTQNFPSGDYTINVLLYDLNDDSELSSVGLRHNVMNVYDKSGERRAGAAQKKFVTFYGNAWVEAKGANRQGTGSQVPRNYVRGELNSNLELGPAPINLHAFYSTENSDLRQNMNTITVSFNDNKFINNLRSQLTQVIMQEKSLKESKYGEAYSKIKKLDNLNRLLESDKMQEQFKELDKVEEIEQKIKSADLQGAVDEINSLKDDITQRRDALNYEAEKRKLKTEISVHKQVSYADSAKEKNRRQKIDSLQTELNRLEQRQDSIRKENKEDLVRIKNLSDKQQEYRELNKKLNKMEDLKAKKKQFEQLKKQKDKLVEFKEKLEEDATLEDISSVDLDKLSDKDFLKQQLLKRGMLSTGERLLYGVEKLSVGTVYPYYSPLVLNGIMVNGVDFKWSPGIFYTAFTFGSSNKATLSLEQGVAAFKQKLIAGKIGLGDKNGTHIHFTALNAIDDPGSIQVADSVARPQSNFIFGTNFGLKLFQGNFSIQGEVAGSKFDSNQDAVDIAGDNPWTSNLPGFLDPNISSAIGLAYDLRAIFRLFKQNTVLSGYVRNIDPGYNSFGAPNLRYGLFSYQAKITQKLFSDKVRLSLFRKNENTARLWSEQIAAFERTGGEIYLRFSNAPYLRASYSQNVHDKRNINKDLQEISVTAGYGYGIGNMSFSNTISYSLNKGESDIAEGPDYNISSYLFSQVVSFQFPLSLSLNVNHIRQEIQGQQTRKWISDLSASFQIFKNMSAGLGGSYKTAADAEERIGGYADIRYNFLEHFTFDLRFKNNYYDDLMMPVNDFEEYILRGRLTVNW